MTHTGDTPGILQQMADARSTCNELMHLLAAENQGLRTHSVDEVEARLQLKRQLTLRLELLMKELKTRKADWQASKDGRTLALRLAEDMEVFRELASKNAEMLRAAHQLRADVVAVIRDTIEAQTPRMTTYGRSGALNHGDNGTRVMAKDI